MRLISGSRALLLVQFVGTLAVLALVPGTVLPVVVLLMWWGITFYPLSRAEWVLFVITNAIFILMDVSVTQRGIFVFAHPSVWGLPLFELFAWGFFYLHAARMIGGKPPRRIWPGLLYAAAVSLSALVMPSVSWTLGALAVLLVLGLLLFRTALDWKYTGYLLVIGLCVEYLGTTLGLWTYTIAHPWLWWVLTWSISGLILYRTALPLSTRVGLYLERRK